MSFVLSLITVLLIVAGAINGVWMTWSYKKSVAENRAMFQAQNVVIDEMKKDLDSARRDAERNRQILESRTPQFEAMMKAEEFQRRAIERLIKERDRQDKDSVNHRRENN